MLHELSTGAFADRLRSPYGIDEFAGAGGGGVILTDANGEVELPPVFPAVVVLAADVAVDHPSARCADVVATGEDLDAVIETIRRWPQASTSYALLLRGSEERTVAEGLHAESTAYGLLQGGPEFAEWRAATPLRQRPPSDEPPVITEVRDGVLHVELNRPAVRNALDAELRDALAEVLFLALAEPWLRVELSGRGAAYSAGGHLDEMGSRPDPASAHLTRMSRSLGWILHQLRDRVNVTMHGHCRGSGIELPAFTESVTARPDTTFGLPELALGLVPGAGGTCSLPRRIGRHRTAWLGLTRMAVDAPTALDWGMIDRIVDERAA